MKVVANFKNIASHWGGKEQMNNTCITKKKVTTNTAAQMI